MVPVPFPISTGPVPVVLRRSPPEPDSNVVVEVVFEDPKLTVLTPAPFPIDRVCVPVPPIVICPVVVPPPMLVVFVEALSLIDVIPDTTVNVLPDATVVLPFKVMPELPEFKVSGEVELVVPIVIVLTAEAPFPMFMEFVPVAPVTIFTVSFVVPVDILTVVALFPKFTIPAPVVSRVKVPVEFAKRLRPPVPEVV